MNFEMAFPGFKDDFNAPAHSIDSAHRLGIPDILGDVGEKDLPSEKSQVGWIGVESVRLDCGEVFSSFAGNMLRHRNGHYPDGQFSSVPAKEHLVKNPCFFRIPSRSKRLPFGWKRAILCEYRLK